MDTLHNPIKSKPSTTIILLLYLIIPIQMTSSLSETEALIQFKQSLQGAAALDATWVPTTTPCGEPVKWNGVICDKNSVIGIRLETMGLSGKIDIDALLNLQGLRTISFNDNRFNGPIPELNRLGSLKAIFLSTNQFSGEIPQDYFAKMSSLKKVWLSKNNFSGQVPSSLARVPSLMELHLENNQFKGPLPSLSQPPLVDLNVANNKLEGEVPKGLSKIPKSSFEGNPGLCGRIMGQDCRSETDEEKPNQTATTTSESPPSGGEDDSSKGTNAVATFLGIVFLMLIVLVFVTKKTNEDEDDHNSNISKENEKLVDIQLASPHASSGSGRKSNASKRSVGGKGGNGAGDLVMVNEEKGIFGLQDLMKASAEVLGNGGTGSAYKAVLSSGVSVTVKRTRQMNRLGREAFDAEMKRLAGLKHKYLLPPLAYHYRKEEKLLVYEYMPKRSLLYCLHGDEKNPSANLDWPIRRKIIKDVAEGMGFLHTQLSSSELPHGNLKSSNILLNNNYEPVMAEYNFCSVVSSNKMQQAQLAYKAPEVAQSQKISKKCDVYCFGVVVLETMTGKFPSVYLPSNKGGIDIAQWVVSAIGEKREAELLDPQITKDSKNVEEMVGLLRIGASCVEPNPDARPDIFEVIQRLEKV